MVYKTLTGFHCMVTGKRVHSALNTYVRSPLTNPLVRKGLCTWQSKIEWKMDGNVVTTRKHIIKQKKAEMLYP